jgi:hypothetical protein
MGQPVAQLFETQRYKPEGSGFDGVIGIFFDIIHTVVIGPGIS